MKASAAFHHSQHLMESQLLPPHSACLFCGSKQRTGLFSLQDNPEIMLLKCNLCGAATASRLPTSEALVEYYNSYYTSSCFRGCDTRITFDNARRFGRHLSKRFLKRNPSSFIRILDFGGGDGTIALETARNIINRSAASVEITVVDLNTTLAIAADERISLIHRKSLDNLQPDSYQFIIASAVIEHLAQPKPAMNDLLNLLSIGGLFYARTPYIVPLTRLMHLIGVKLDFTFPAHIHDLGQDFWESYFTMGICPGHFSVLESQPSIVETSLARHTIRTVTAYLLKGPYYIFGSWWKLVGGWEVFVRKESSETVATSSH
jgi:SAM-dependent methyltransferase